MYNFKIFMNVFYSTKETPIPVNNITTEMAADILEKIVRFCV